jgi:hypothetical protein
MTKARGQKERAAREDREKSPKERKHYRTRRPLDDSDREGLTAALMRHLIRPGLVPACEIIVEHMLENNDLASAHALVRTAKELVQKGFPEPGPSSKAKKLREELEALENDLGSSGGSGNGSSEPGAEREDVGEGGTSVLPRDEEVPAVPPVPGSPQ